MTMAKHRTGALVAFLGLAAAALPIVAHADAPDPPFDCGSTPHAFISSLIEANAIDPQPTRIEADSVNAFRLKPGAGLRAFGFPIYAVFGYQRDDTLFRPGSGRAKDGPVYGVVVSAPADPVRERVRDAGSGAHVQSVVPLLLTAIVCDGR